MRWLTNFLMLLGLLLVTAGLPGCLLKKKIQKPDIEWFFNLPMGFCGSTTSQTKVKKVYSPTKCAVMKSGEYFWVHPSGLAKTQAAMLSLCEATGQCNADAKIEINSNFDFMAEIEKIKAQESQTPKPKETK